MKPTRSPSALVDSAALSLLALAAFAYSCAARQPPPAPAPAPAIRFLAGYPATLLYALDAAAGELNHDPGYRAWIAGGGPAPWLDAYAEHRRAWAEAVRPDRGGGVPAFEACGWEAQDVEAQIRCVEGIVPARDRAVAEAAIREADTRLRPRWAELGARTAAMLPELDRSLRTERAAALFRTLRDEAGLGPGVPLDFKVVLVAKPPGAHSYARQEGEFLVHEVGPDETPGALLAIAFHEVAHLAHYESPRRAETEQAFVRFGQRGWITANAWDEALATAFGNGLAAEQFDPGFRVERSFYADPWIDRLGRAVYREWKAGRSVRLGVDLAPRLVEIADREWPADQRPLSRYLWYVTVYAQDRAIAREALRGVHYRSASRVVPIDDALPAGAEMTPWAPRLVLLTVADLAQRPALAARANIPAGSWDAAVAATGAAVFRHDDPGGAAVFVVVARDADVLRAKASVFAARPAMVGAGWTTLP